MGRRFALTMDVSQGKAFDQEVRKWRSKMRHAENYGLDSSEADLFVQKKSWRRVHDVNSNRAS